MPALLALLALAAAPTEKEKGAADAVAFFARLAELRKAEAAAFSNALALAKARKATAAHLATLEGRKVFWPFAVVRVDDAGEGQAWVQLKGGPVPLAAPRYAPELKAHERTLGEARATLHRTKTDFRFIGPVKLPAAIAEPLRAESPLFLKVTLRGIKVRHGWDIVMLDVVLDLSGVVAP